MGKFLHILPLCCALSLSAHGADIEDYRNRPSSRALGSANITAIAQDAQGFIWVATRSELVRFDGYRYTPLERPLGDTLFEGENRIRQLSFEGAESLWIASDNGLFCYNTRLHTLRSAESLRGVRINSMHPAASGLLLNTSCGLFFYAHGQVRPLLEYDRQTSMTSMAFDAQGDCWLSVEGYLLHLPAPQQLLVAGGSSRADTIARFPTAQRILIDRHNTLRLWDREHLTTARIEGGGVRGERTEPLEISAMSVVGDDIYLGDRGKSNRVLRCDASGKVVRIEELPVTSRYDDLSGTTNLFFSDAQGNIWIGTRAGLFMLRRGPSARFHHLVSDINIANTLSHSTISAIHIADRNTIWIGTAYGLNRLTFSDGAAGAYRVERFLDTNPSGSSVTDNKIGCIATDADGVMWLGTKGVLRFYDPQRNRFFDRPAIQRALAGRSFVRALRQAPNGDMWIGFEQGGIFHYRCSDQRLARVAQGENCLAIACAPGGIVWAISKSDGILRIDPSAESYQIRTYSIEEREQPLSQAIHADKHGNIWVGTSRGLYKYSYDTDVFVHMPTGNTRAYIVGMIDDSRGNLWIATTTGICRYNISEGSIRTAMLYKGDFARPGFVFDCAIDADGIVFLGGINGLTWFDPEQVIFEAGRHEVYFTDFRIHNRPVEPDGGILQQDINATERIVLRQADNQFSFSFSALSYEGGEQLRYSYMLAPIDDDWVEASGEQSISYSHLRAGNYTLLIRSIDPSGPEQIRQLQIRVRAPLWGAWYSLLFYLVVAMGIVVLVLRERALTLQLRAQMSMLDGAHHKYEVNPSQVQELSGDERFLTRAMEVIESRMGSDEFGVEDFASRMHLSPSMLYRRIKALTDLSPSELIRSMRLKRAAQLLASHAYTVSEVALQVGFIDMRYFSTCFKKAFGVPPSQYS